MTREENLYWIDQEIRTWENECQSKHPIKEALYVARKVLEQEPCEDAVSREAVRDAIEYLGIKLGIDFVKVLLLQKTIKALPSVTPQPPRKGHWEVVSDGYSDNAYICECSECKDTVWVYKDADRKWNYCPNCGAELYQKRYSRSYY